MKYIKTQLILKVLSQKEYAVLFDLNRIYDYTTSHIQNETFFFLVFKKSNVLGHNEYTFLFI